MQKNDKPIIVEQTYNSSIEEVWEAITDIDQMKQWYFENIPEFKPQVGFETKFLVESGGRKFTHKWRITEVLPQKLITYKWKYEEYKGEGLVSFELSIQDNLTKLRLINAIVESFPQDIPEFARESCIGGWEYFISKRLVEFLESRK